MKATVKTSRTAGYLEKIFRALNEDSFGGRVEEPIITIQSTPGAYGHCSVHKTWKRKEDNRHELNISANYLQRPIEEVVATMIHEMVHLWNIQNGIQDCSRGNTYHNRKFKEEAEKHMLRIEKHEKYGWTITLVTDDLLEYILDKGWSDIDMGQGSYGGFGFGGGKGGYGGTSKPVGGEKPKGTNSRRYKCPGCGALVRATRDLDIVCKPCGLDFVLT